MKFLFWAALACIIFSFAALGARGAVVPGDDYHADSVAAAATLQQWYNRNGLWDTAGWWNAANCIESLENVIEAQNGGPYLAFLPYTFELNATNNFLNEYYDDEGWWALAWVRAFDLTGDTRYLEMAKTIFQDLVGGWNARCDGGLQWRKSRSYKNAIPNELFLLVAVRLHERTPGDAGPGSYLEWALREWDWFERTGMLNAQNLINDGLDRYCQNDGRTTWTYNQGVILGGLTELYKVTGDRHYLDQAVAIADAATMMLVDDNGVLREPCESRGCHGGDVPQFKGIFIRYLAGLYDETHKPVYLQFLLRNAHSVWFNDRNDANQLGLSWAGPFDFPDAARQSSALTALSVVAEPMTTSLPFAAGAGGPWFNHEIGTASGTLAWTCAGSNAPGYMLSGPFLASLRPGAHTLHVRLAASAASRSATSLARLDVKASGQGVILAAREIAWRSFGRPGEPRDFALPFTNTVATGALEFRVHWRGARHAPALTLTDVTVDGAHNWTAANLAHDCGRLDRFNSWEADPVHDTGSGYLVRGPACDELRSGDHSARFELKVDNFNWDDSRVAMLSVADAQNGAVLASREITRREFTNTLYHHFDLPFKARSGKRYQFRTYWFYAPHAPRLTQRSIIVTP